jgi:ABC-type antimicrobial peptide transport system ATPase subunit
MGVRLNQGLPSRPMGHQDAGTRPCRVRALKGLNSRPMSVHLCIEDINIQFDTCNRDTSQIRTAFLSPKGVLNPLQTGGYVRHHEVKYESGDFF